MEKPRISGQSIIEYVVIFAIVAIVSVVIFPRIQPIFDTYNTNATEKMK